MRPNTPFLVGEEGPELFAPPGFGEIINNRTTVDALAPAPPVVVSPPQVNVSVVNVTDPDEITAAMESPEGQKVFMNIMRRNRRQIRNAIAT